MFAISDGNIWCCNILFFVIKLLLYCVCLYAHVYVCKSSLDLVRDSEVHVINPASLAEGSVCIGEGFKN